MVKKLIVRADDLGYSEGVNCGIAKTVKDGIVGSVGIMTNMPTARHGIDLLKGTPVCYGQHTNICVGHPLTDPRLIPSLCQENGTFKSSKAYREASERGEDFVSLDEAILEIEAQYYRFVELVGERPHYFEMHAIYSQNFMKGLELVAKRYDLPYLKLSWTSSEQCMIFREKKLHITMDASTSNYDPFESLKKAVLHTYEPDSYGTFICHPGYLDDFILRNSSLTINRTKEVAMLCDPAVKTWLDEQGVELITYDDV